MTDKPKSEKKSSGNRAAIGAAAIGSAAVAAALLYAGRRLTARKKPKRADPARPDPLGRAARNRLRSDSPMQPLTRVEGRAIPARPEKNVRYRHHHSRQNGSRPSAARGLGAGAFEALRAEPGNVIDDPAYAGASLLIAGDNFGCGVEPRTRRMGAGRLWASAW